MITCFREWPMRGALGSPAPGAFAACLPAGASVWHASGRAALHDALGRLGVPSGAAVLMPAYIAAGVIEPVRARGLVPAFYRTGSDLLASPAALEKALAARPDARAAVVLHPMGRAQDLAAFAALCRARGVALIEDCAQGLFSKDPAGRPLGSDGDAALFSLPKFLGTADGAVVTLRRGGEAPGPAGRHGAARRAGAWHKAHVLANRLLHDAPPAAAGALLALSGALHERYYALAGADFRPAAPAASTLAALSRVDPALVASRRRANVERLYSGLKTSALRLVYPQDRPGWVPMAVPAFADARRRAELQARARARGVLLASLCQRWDHIPAAEAPAFAAEREYLDRHVLIPVNEHIDEAAMAEVVRALNEL